MKVYKVGGCVRDYLLNLPSSDTDYVVVGSTPEEMKSRGFTQVGADFPVFLHPDTKDEYALARTERKSGPGYNGFETNFDKSVTLGDDLQRRDLTINSIAMDKEGNYFDPCGGIRDLLREKVLRHTSEAFSDDPLRVIRLARFYARFDDFTVAPATIELCKKMVASGQLNEITKERFWGEIEKVFAGAHIHRFFEFLYEVEANRYVDFFSSLLNFKSLGLVKIIIQDFECPREFRLEAFLMRLRTPNSETMQSASKFRQQLTQLYISYLDANDPETMYDFLLKAGAFSQKAHLEIFMKIIPSSSEELTPFLGKVQAVKAADFPGVTGKELGDKIKETRIKILKKYL